MESGVCIAIDISSVYVRPLDNCHFLRPVMKVTQEELAEARVPIPLRDYCAHLFIPLAKCRNETYYLPWKCKKEKHLWEQCQFEE